MQFSYRVSAIAAISLTPFIILTHAFWNGKEWNKKSETIETELNRLKRQFISLQTNVQEYEAVVAALRRDLLHNSIKYNVETVSNPSSSSEVMNKVFSVERLKTFSILDSLPHLIDSKDALTPALTLGKGRTGVSVVIGIPTVKRLTECYILPTLVNLLGSMLPEEKNDTLIIIFIADSDTSIVDQTVNSIIKEFPKDVASGLVEVIAPSSNFYPNLTTVKRTLGDSDDRTRWRTKQNLDYAFLMMYAQPRGTFYVQLEDDVLSKKGFITSMKNFTVSATKKTEDWLMLDFCQLGFIGKLFRSSDLWKVVEFILLFYQDMPGDWLLSRFFSVKYCTLDQSLKECRKELNKHWVHYKPSLFQHVGTVSSLDGKVQKLKDGQFGKLELFVKHDNPKATVETSITEYGKFTLEKAYNGKTFFWGLASQKGDSMTFVFAEPSNLKSYRFVSGNPEHPSDKVRNATFEVLPAEMGDGKFEFFKTEDNFFVIDEFDELGVLEGRFPMSLCPISAVRITLKYASDYWVILSEIFIEQE